MIRRLHAPDDAALSRLAAIHAAAFQPHARGWSPAEIGALARDGALYADDAGFILMRAVLDEAEVLTIAVTPEAQGQGVGRALLSHALDDLGEAEIFLEVAADNTAAIALYRAAGFERTGLRKGYYKRPGGSAIDALIMRRAGDMAG